MEIILNLQKNYKSSLKNIHIPFFQNDLVCNILPHLLHHLCSCFLYPYHTNTHIHTFFSFNSKSHTSQLFTPRCFRVYFVRERIFYYAITVVINFSQFNIAIFFLISLANSNFVNCPRMSFRAFFLSGKDPV